MSARPQVPGAGGAPSRDRPRALGAPSRLGGVKALARLAVALWGHLRWWSCSGAADAQPDPALADSAGAGRAAGASAARSGCAGSPHNLQAPATRRRPEVMAAAFTSTSSGCRWRAARDATGRRTAEEPNGAQQAAGAVPALAAPVPRTPRPTAAAPRPPPWRTRRPEAVTVDPSTNAAEYQWWRSSRRCSGAGRRWRRRSRPSGCSPPSRLQPARPHPPAGRRPRGPSTRSAAGRVLHVEIRSGPAHRPPHLSEWLGAAATQEQLTWTRRTGGRSVTRHAAVAGAGRARAGPPLQDGWLVVGDLGSLGPGSCSPPRRDRLVELSVGVALPLRRPGWRRCPERRRRPRRARGRARRLRRRRDRKASPRCTCSRRAAGAPAAAGGVRVAAGRGRPAGAAGCTPHCVRARGPCCRAGRRPAPAAKTGLSDPAPAGSASSSPPSTCAAPGAKRCATQLGVPAGSRSRPGD